MDPDLLIVEGLNTLAIRENADVLDLNRLECNDIYAVRHLLHNPNFFLYVLF